MRHTIRFFGAGIGWLLICVITILSVVPPSARPTTGTSSNLEHVAIYVLTGIAFAVGYRNRLTRVIVGLVVFPGLIEAMQLWVPGRHARLSDLIIDVVAACAGALGTAAFEKLIGTRAQS